MAVALIGNGFRAHVSVAGDSRDESSFSWSYNPGAPAAGVFVAVFSGSITNQATGVTYGGQAMDLVAEAHVSGAEDTGTVALYFLGSDIPAGNQTIEVSRNNNSTRMGAIGAAVSADADTEIYADGIALLEGNGSVSEQNADDGLQSGSPDSLRFAAGWFGHGSPPPAGPNSDADLWSYQWVSSNQSARVVVEAMGGNGPRPVGFSTATADERAIVHFAIREAQGGATLLRIESEQSFLAEGVLRLMNLSRIHTESLEIDEAIIWQRGLLRLVTDGMSMSEAEFTLRGIFRIMSESLEIDEIDSHIVGLLHIVLEGIQVEEDSQKLQDLIRLVEGESIQITETDLDYRSLMRLVNEDVTIEEQHLRFRYMVRVQDEVIPIPETIIRQRDMLRIQNELASVVEQIIKQLGILRIYDSSINITEDLRRMLGVVRIHNEDVSIDEAILHMTGIITPTPDFATIDVILDLKARNVLIGNRFMAAVVHTAIRDVQTQY